MIGYQDKINQILRGAETIKNMNETDKNGRLVKKWDVKDVEELKSLVEELERELHQAKAQRDNILLIAHNLKEAIESTFTASKDPFNADSSYEYIETHGWTHEILKFAREEIKKLEVS